MPTFCSDSVHHSGSWLFKLVPRGRRPHAKQYPVEIEIKPNPTKPSLQGGQQSKQGTFPPQTRSQSAHHALSFLSQLLLLVHYWKGVTEISAVEFIIEREHVTRMGPQGGGFRRFLTTKHISVSRNVWTEPREAGPGTGPRTTKILPSFTAPQRVFTEFYRSPERFYRILPLPSAILPNFTAPQRNFTAPQRDFTELYRSSKRFWPDFKISVESAIWKSQPGEYWEFTPH